MRVKSLAACILALATLLVGCTDADQPPVSPPASSVATDDYDLTAEELREIDEEIMVEDKDRYVGGSDVPDADFVTFGRDVCAQFDSGQGFESVLTFTIHEWDERFHRRLGYFEGAELVGDSVGSLCEQHMSQLE